MELLGFNFSITRKREAQLPAPKNGVPASSNEQAPAIKTGTYESRIVQVSRPEVAPTIATVYRAIELKAKTIGQMEMQYQRKDTERGNFVQAMYGEAKRLNWMLQKRPNPMMTGSELFQQMSIHRELLGNAFVYIERDRDGEPRNLWLALCGGYDPMNGSYTITYNTPEGPRNRFEVPREDIIHWRNTYRVGTDGYMGIPTHVFAIQTLSMIATQKQLAIETAAKGGRTKLLISEDQPSPTQGTYAYGRLSKEEVSKYADEVNDRIYVKDVTALHGLDKVFQISMTAQDMQMMEMLGISNDDVARYYSTPRPLLMLDTNSHYNDYQNATMEYMQRCIGPLAGELEDLFYNAFLNEYDFDKLRFHMCELPLLRMDLERQAKVDQYNLQTGAKTVNEIRKQYDMPAVKDGDIVYVSTNLAELGSAKLREPSPSGRPSGQKNNDNGEEDE